MQKRIPAEFEKQAAILLAFPHNGRDWPGKFKAIQWAFVEFIKKITIYEKVLLIVRDKKHHKVVLDKIHLAGLDLNCIDFIYKKTDRSWMRDTGPIIIFDENAARVALKFDFNGWAKYENFRKDRKIPEAVASHLNIPTRQVKQNNQSVVLEGGAIDYNGQGTLITTKECLLHPTVQIRNPGFGAPQYEGVFRNHMGVEQVIWLEDGIEGDDTHGHVDDICRFVDANTVVLAEEKKVSDCNHRILEENRERLEGIYLKNGNKLQVVRMPMPGRIDFDKMRLPASYVNFLIINEAVLVPTFNDPNDYLALGIMRELMPEREVIGISSLDLIWGLGTLHCLSREIPSSSDHI